MPAQPTDRDLLIRLVTLVEPMVEQQTKQDDRIGALELWRSRTSGYVAGMLAAAGALGGGVGAIVRAFGH